MMKSLPKSLSYSMTVNDRSDMRLLLVMLTYVEQVVEGRLLNCGLLSRVAVR